MKLNKFVLIILLFFLLFSIFSIFSIWIGITNPILLLNENQILYLSSTSSQVLAGIYGLTLTGYIFFRNELSREEFEDDSLSEAVEELKNDDYKNLIFITFFTLFSLVLLNITISIENSHDKSLNEIFINISQTSYVINLMLIAYFIFEILEPKRIEKVSKRIQKELEPSLDNLEKSELGSIEEFLKNFNQIEYIVQKYGNAYYDGSTSKQLNDKRRFSNIKLIQIIFHSEKISFDLCEELIKLVKLRNSIVHGAEPKVSKEIVEKSESNLKDLKEFLKVK